MKIKIGRLRRIIREALGGSKIIRERPWSVEYTFKMSGGDASDSEGKSPDGFAIAMSSESGTIVRVIVDAYWNPQSGDSSGNSIQVEIDGYKVDESYVPVAFNNGKEQRLVISNSPKKGMIVVSHAGSSKDLPIPYLAVDNPFLETEDVKFDIENLGGGDVEVELSGHTNV